MSERNSKWALIAAVVACFASACGDDDTTPEAGTGGKGGSSATTAGAGGSKAGSGGSGKAGSGGGNAAVMCGGQTCAVNSTLMGINPMAKACCTSDNKCGQTNGAGKCLQKSAPGTKDTSCPNIEVMVGGMSYPQMGCCNPKGYCGGDFAQVEWGCVAREDVGTDMGGPLSAMMCGGGAGSGGSGGAAGRAGSGGSAGGSAGASGAAGHAGTGGGSGGSSAGSGGSGGAAGH